MLLPVEGGTRWRERGGAQWVSFRVTPGLFSFSTGEPVEAVAHNMQWSLEWRHVQIRTVLLGTSSGHPTMLWICLACNPEQNEAHKQPLIHCMQLFPKRLKHCAQADQHLQHTHHTHCSTAMYSTLQQIAPEHSTAEHSTAQHAKHSMHSTACTARTAQPGTRRAQHAYLVRLSAAAAGAEGCLQP